MVVWAQKLAALGVVLASTFPILSRVFAVTSYWHMCQWIYTCQVPLFQQRAHENDPVWFLIRTFTKLALTQQKQGLLYIRWSNALSECKNHEGLRSVNESPRNGIKTAFQHFFSKMAGKTKPDSISKNDGNSWQFLQKSAIWDFLICQKSLIGFSESQPAFQQYISFLKSRSKSQKIASLEASPLPLRLMKQAQSMQWHKYDQDWHSQKTQWL